MPANPVTVTDLADGIHRVVLRVVDQCDTVWQHEMPVTVANTQIISPNTVGRLQGNVPLVVSTGYLPHELRTVSINLVPVFEAMLQTDETRVLYSGSTVPSGLALDTRKIDDGAYELQFVVESTRGTVSRSTSRLAVGNWEVLTDEFEPPLEQGWFGMLERNRTIAESQGWGYATNNAEDFLGDGDRRIWSGTGSGHLVWAVPGIRSYTIILYSHRGGEGVQVSVSSDRNLWHEVPFELVETGSTDTGWRRLELRGQPSVNAANFLRITVPEGMDASRVQLGRVDVTHARR